MACEVNKQSCPTIITPNLTILTLNKTTGARPHLSATRKPVRLNGYLGQLPPQHLADLCLRLKLQLVQQRLPHLCASCQQHIMSSLEKMDLNLTKMLRGLCQCCRDIFMDNRPITGNNAHPDGVPQTSTATKVRDDYKIKKVIINVRESLNSKLTSLYEEMTKAGIPWCRYCGSFNEPNMQQGPWGEETLCFIHGCQYHGLGESVLNLDVFATETKEDRKRPIMQEAAPCSKCGKEFNAIDERVYCRCCPKVCHKTCVNVVLDLGAWFCGGNCSENFNSFAMNRLSGLSPCVPLASPSPRKTTPKPRYAKRLSNSSLISAPLTPPPTPTAESTKPKRGRKRRSTADQVPDIMICFEPDAIIRRSYGEKRGVVFTPEFKQINFPPKAPPVVKRHKKQLTTGLSELSDSQMALQHDRFEAVEKEMRILRPEVLNSLYNKKPIENKK